MLFLYSHIILSIFLIFLILIQRSESGVGGAFGGGDSATGGVKRRGSEKILFIITIAVAILFVLSVVLDVFVW